MTDYLPDIFKPHGLRPQSRIYGYCQHLETEKTIYWCYDTIGEKIKTDYNCGCYDVSKTRVHEIHQKALGYSHKVNPMTCEIPYLEKDERQGRHKCKILTKNQEPEEGKVYEILMDNSREIRYMRCRTGEDYAFDKVRIANDFSMSYITAKVVKNRDLNADALMAARAFSAEFGLDFGEMDILFHNGLPYIVDVNNVAGAGRLFARCDFPKLARELYIEQIKSL